MVSEEAAFKKDILNLVYLCKHYGLEEVAEYWHQVLKINNYQKQRFAQKIIDHFEGNIRGKKIAILGWAFKANTNDSRESASIHVSEILYKNGAFLQIYDPMVSHKNIIKDIKIYWNKRLKIPLNKDNFKILDQLKNVDPKTDLFVILTE